MSYEVRTIPGCPNSGPAVELFKNVLHAEGLEPELLTVREISSESEAAAVLFRGSPSFLAGGKDLFPSTADAGLSCRLYPADTGLSGLPSAESLRAAVRGTAARSVLVLSAAALAVTDLSVKAALVQTLGHDSHDTDFGLFTVRVAYDTGAGFGPLSWLPPGALVLGAVALVAVLAAVLVRAAPRLRKLSLSGAALLLGGALGNLVDLLDGDGVVDYLHTGWLPSSNLAGVFVVAGAGLLVLGTVRGAVGEGQ